MIKNLNIPLSKLTEEQERYYREKGMTGFSFLDKPYQKYYAKHPIREIDPHKTMYQSLFDLNRDNMGSNALGYLGMFNWTYKDFQKQVEAAAKTFKSLGVKEGDTVPIAIINGPAAAINLAAINLLGATSKWIDVRASGKNLIHYLCENNCKLMVAWDKLSPSIDSILRETDVKKVLTISASDSLSVGQKLKFVLKNGVPAKEETVKLSNQDRFENFKKLCKLHANDPLITPVSFNKDRPSLIVQSSGTTGMAKSIIHTDYSVLSFVRKIAFSDLPLHQGKTLTTPVPPWVAYGLIDSMYLALSFGMKIEFIPTFDPDSVFKMLGNFDVCFAAPFQERYFGEHPEEVAAKLKKVKRAPECMITGGDKITEEELISIERSLGVAPINGYGNNEVLGAATFNPQRANKFGSVGIPKYKDDIMIWDIENQVALPYNTIGEVCIKSDSMFLEYVDREEETRRVKQKHGNEEWVHMGDAGYVDEDGYLYLSGRITRTIIREGFKLSPMTIEKAIQTVNIVKECIVVPVEDEKVQQVPMAYVTLKPEVMLSDEEVFALLHKRCVEELKDNEVPSYFRILEEMPYTPNNKYDFKKLEKMGNDDVQQKKQLTKKA